MKYRVTLRKPFKLTLRKKREKAGFYTQLDKLVAEFFKGQFFDDLTTIREDELRERARQERYQARRQANLSRTPNVLKRLHRVQNIDLFQMTREIGPDFFGEKHLQFDAVKELHEKKARIVWYLLGLYRYLAFDAELNGWSAKRGFHYSRHRKQWFVLLAAHKERVRQEKWDLKRAKVRARRAKAEERANASGLDSTQAILYATQRGVGNSVPTRLIPVLEEIEWD